MLSRTSHLKNERKGCAFPAVSPSAQRMPHKRGERTKPACMRALANVAIDPLPRLISVGPGARSRRHGPARLLRPAVFTSVALSCEFVPSRLGVFGWCAQSAARKFAPARFAAHRCFEKCAGTRRETLLATAIACQARGRCGRGHGHFAFER